MLEQQLRFSSQKNINIRSITPPLQKSNNSKIKKLNEIRLEFTQLFQKRFTMKKKKSLESKDLTKNISDNQFKKQFRIPTFVKKAIQSNKNTNSSIENIIFDNYKNIKRFYKRSIQQPYQHVSINSIETSQQIQENQYKKANIKLDLLQKKIRQMKLKLDNKRSDQISFMQNQKRERINLNLFDLYNQRNNPEQQLKNLISQVPQHKDIHLFNENPYLPKQSIYYVSQILRAYKQQKSSAYQHINTSLQYIKMFSSLEIADQRGVKILLPKCKGYQDKKTVIFDLDQTLIHCTQSLMMPNDLKINVKFPTGQSIQVGINIRPYAKQILAALSTQFQIMVFTASHSCYANVVIDHLDPQKKFIHHRLFRQHCYCTSQGIYVKDLRIINRPLSKVILIDNAAYSYAYQLLNGVPIIPYYEGKNDHQLPALQKYIESLLLVNDVRQKNRITFKLDKYVQFNDLDKLVETLYQANTLN